MSNFPNRRWLVIPAELVETVDFNEVLQTSSSMLRYSLDKTKTFVKYEVTIILHVSSFIGTFSNNL